MRGLPRGVKQSRGGVGLVFRENALKAIAPGHPGRSELIKRIRHTDPELRMPYGGPPMDEEAIRTIERWIEQGAEWEDHWAYLPPAPTEPNSELPEGGNPIDGFVRDRLLPLGMDLSPAAPPHTLLRRLAFDLTGLPPSPEEVAAFVADCTIGSGICTGPALRRVWGPACATSAATSTGPLPVC